MIRADVFLVNEGYSRSREQAQRSIEAGLVIIDGRTVKKSSEKIDETLEHSVTCENTVAYVGRGGLKLEAALDGFRISPESTVCFDIGASTGGFTDCLLKRGAVKVYAIDSGRDQLAAELRADPRVTSIEGMNARFLSFEDVGSLADIIVMDVSFISQTLILPRFPVLMNEGGKVVTLIKPQFECGRGALGKGGIVRKPEHRLNAVRRVVEAAKDNGLHLHGLIRSPIEGGDGNVEFLAYFKKEINCMSDETVLGKVDYK